MLNFIQMLKNEEGQDLLEYALLVALIAIFCVTAVGLAGGQVVAVFDSITTSLQNSL